MHKRTALIGMILLAGITPGAFAQSPSETLPGTKRLTIEKPLDEVMVAGISQFALRALQQSPIERDAHWSRDYRTADAYEKSVDPNRERLRRIIGAIDRREAVGGFELVAKIGQDGV